MYLSPIRLLLPLFAALSACAGSQPLAEGTYLETRGPNVALFSSKELRLLPDQRFEYYRHEDVVGAGRYGSGTYELRGRQLRLRFNGKSLTRNSYADSAPLATAAPDSLRLSFAVSGMDSRDQNEPLSFATVAVYSAGVLVSGSSCDSLGRATVTASRTMAPLTLRVMSIGWHALELPRPAANTAYQVYLQPNLGQPYPRGTKWGFRVLDRSADTLTVLSGSDTLTLVRRPAKL